jgi:ubiquinone/menaquinone biosynthesis C-methylase UbiE
LTKVILMSLATDQKRLLQHQYQNAANLSARISLHARFSLNTYGWHPWVFDQFQLPPNARILELGCGSGALWLRNLERIPAGWDITLSDFSAGMVGDARSNLEGSAPPFTFQQMDAQSIPLPDASVDAVIANHMLYHVPDRNEAFSEIRRVLKPTGMFYAATNGLHHLREMSQLQQRFGVGDDLSVHSELFRLENGQEQLTPWFSHVTMRHYKDGLRVTEADPLIAFILSQSDAYQAEDARIVALRAYVEEELARKGAIEITKSSGLFLASSEQADMTTSQG